jgi:hypothetical protein
MTQTQDSETVFKNIFGDGPIQELLTPLPSEPSPQRLRYSLPFSSPCVYVLRLSGCHFYVGQTTNINNRLQEHREGRGCSWTRKYPVLSVDVFTAPDNTSLEQLELITTIEQMKKRGIHRVRGSCFSQPEFSNKDVVFAQRLICTTSNWCFNCGKQGHVQGGCLKPASIWPPKPALDEDLAWEYRYFNSEVARFDTEYEEHNSNAARYGVLASDLESVISNIDARIDEHLGRETASQTEIFDLTVQLREIAARLQQLEEEKRDVVAGRRQVERDRRACEGERITYFKEVAVSNGKANDARQESLRAKSALSTLAGREAPPCPTCSKPLQLKKSSTAANPERLFLACFTTKENGDQHYFKWIS